MLNETFKHCEYFKVYFPHEKKSLKKGRRNFFPLLKWYLLIFVSMNLPIKTFFDVNSQDWTFLGFSNNVFLESRTKWELCVIFLLGQISKENGWWWPHCFSYFFWCKESFSVCHIKTRKKGKKTSSFWFKGNF